MNRPFEGIFGNTCELRILEFLLPLREIKFNVTELAEEAKISRVTAGRVIKKFAEWNILNVHDRGVTEYSINPDSPIVKSVDALNNAIIGEMLGEEKLNEISEYISERQNVQNSKSTAFSSGINGSSNTDNSDSNNGYNTGGDDGNDPVPGYCGEEHKYVCHGHKGER
ncbi:winged helix-turn-helix domain-containing protein [Methanoplanus endosymbiosus]|uniref:Winged helix-turn-helix domain-containing protein n=1 Tax=Methanoplanus endosymbiosus TaxID=33865 RepID=A0A9E7TL04_9EURY|nr:winged helix-turn-helix domain-containing protein [Methanoplanus endosymbiosus]UUX93195.1 winged helix-turn-helix domain-containing protein [Methanoplanus endosymbiosus]